MNDESVQLIAQRIQTFFREKDKSDDFTYLSWDKLNEKQKNFWLQCASYAAVNGEENE